MKKMWIVAAIVCAALMVSCGGEKKGSAESVEDKAKVLYQAIEDAKTDAEAEAAWKAWGEFLDTLSDEDVDKALKAAESIEPSSECVAQAKTPDSACCVETDNVSGATTTTANTATNTYTDEEVVAKSTELTNRIIAAIEAGNMELVEKISAEGDAYIATLSDAQAALFEETSNNIAKAAGMYEE